MMCDVDSDSSSSFGNAKIIEILVFQKNQHLEDFVTASEPLRLAGISRRILSETVLLIAKEATVKSEVWGRYRFAGIQTICGSPWESTWHETMWMHDTERDDLDKLHSPYVEVFRGEDAYIWMPAGVDPHS